MVQVDDNWIQKKFKIVLRREDKKKHSKKLKQLQTIMLILNFL